MAKRLLLGGARRGADNSRPRFADIWGARPAFSSPPDELGKPRNRRRATKRMNSLCFKRGDHQVLVGADRVRTLWWHPVGLNASAAGGGAVLRSWVVARRRSNATNRRRLSTTVGLSEGRWDYQRYQQVSHIRHLDEVTMIMQGSTRSFRLMLATLLGGGIALEFL